MQNKSNKNLTTVNGGLSFLIMITVYLSVTLVGQLILMLVGVTEGFVYYVISGLFSSISMIAVIILNAVKTKQKLVKIVNFTPVNPVYILYAIVLAIGMFFGFGFLNDALSRLFASWGLNAGGVSLSINNFIEFIVYTVVLAVLPAILEEAFFRGAMLSGLDGKAFSVSVTVGVCFAVYHGSFSQFAYQFIYGFSLCFLAIKAKSAIPSAVAHFINNFVVLLFTYLKIAIDLTNLMVIVMGICLLIVYWVSLVCYKSKKRTIEHVAGEDSVTLRQFWLPFGVCATAICSMLMILSLFS